MSSFAFIDVLRAVAATLVLVYHVIEVGSFRAFPSAGPLGAFHVGWIGVDLFLVISGFVIARSALRDFDRHGPAFRKTFFRRRLARIVPLYLFSSIVYVFAVDPNVLYGGVPIVLRNVLLHALFLHNLDPATHGALNGVTWSIALEMQFYVVIALATPWLARVRALPFLAAMVMTSIAYRYFVATLPFAGHDPGVMRFIFTTQLPGTLDAFGIGIATAIALRRGGPFARAGLSSSPRNAGIFALLGLGVLAHALHVFWGHGGDYWEHPSLVALWRAELALGFGLVLCAAITFPRGDAKVLRPLRYVGDISYGLYLWHMMVLVKLDPLPGVDGYRLLAMTFVGAALIAAATWHMIEKPMIAAAAEAA